MNPSIKKNLALQTCYQILSVCLPLITAPYLARVLGPAPLGVFSYTSSIVGYFILFALFGTVNYGTRTIASVRNDTNALNKNFWSIYVFQLFSTSIFMVAYGVYVLFFCQENQLIAFLQGFLLLNCVVDISWLFFGLENFLITVTRSAIVRFLTLLCILLFVKKPEDLWIYTIIMAGGTFLSQAILWFNLPQAIHFYRPTLQEIVAHIKPNLMLFFPLLAVSVYHLMDKTMLGIMSTYEQTGFYYNADKVVNIPLAILNGVGTVLLPRMSALIKEENHHAADDLFIQAVSGIAIISISMGMGIAAVAKEFVPLFFGPGYEPCVLLVYLFVPIFIIKSFSHISSTQFLIPRHQENNLTISICIGAVCNLVCNVLLIPTYGALGAVIGTLSAELVACGWQYKFVWQKIKLKTVLLQILVYLLFGGIMFLGVQQLENLLLPVYILFLLKMGVGILIYGTLCIVYWKVTKNPFLLQLRFIMISILHNIQQIIVRN